MLTVEDILKTVGMSEHDALIFKTCLQYGPISLATLARLTGIKRSTLYGKVAQMQEHGYLQEQRTSVGMKVFALSYNELITLFRKKEKEMNQTIDFLEKQKGFFDSFKTYQDHFGQVIYYNSDQIYSVIFEKIRTAPELFAVFDIDAALRHYKLDVKHAVDYIMAGGGISQEILFDSQNAKLYQKLLKKTKHQVKILRISETTSTDFILMHQSFFQVIYSDQGIIGLEIRHPLFYKTQKILFDELWKRL